MAAWLRMLQHKVLGRSTIERRSRVVRRPRSAVSVLEHRVVPAVDVTAFNLAAGTVTFTGDQNSTTADSLFLSEVSVDLGGGNIVSRLAHNLVGNGGAGNYFNAMDVDPSILVSYLVIGSGSAPLLTVNLGTDADVLTLDSTWSFGHKIAFDGGAGSDALQGADSTATWTLTGPGAGHLNGATRTHF